MNTKRTSNLKDAERRRATRSSVTPVERRPLRPPVGGRLAPFPAQAPESGRPSTFASPRDVQTPADAFSVPGVGASPAATHRSFGNSPLVGDSA
jgi:hypothetical protein